MACRAHLPGPSLQLWKGLMHPEELREELRISDRAVVFLDLPVPPSDDTLTAGSGQLLCRLEDASANGMRLRLDRPLEEGMLVTLRARLAGDPELIRLVAEVRWVSREASGYRAGLRVIESQQYDVARWKLLVADRL